MKGRFDEILFRTLTVEEEEEFRRAARKWQAENPDGEISELWHPVYRAEIERIRNKEGA